jgi:transaldolase
VADVSGADSASTTEANGPMQLVQAGQSLWLDNLSRKLLATGALNWYVREFGLSGLTSNPTILAQAMTAGKDYDATLRTLVGQGVSDPQDLVYGAALEDLAAAAHIFHPAWKATDGVDGYVSLEVPPDLAFKAADSVAWGMRLWGQAKLPNLLVKVPGTAPGLTAVEELVTAGVGVNVTLLFSETHYLQAAEAYMRALERRLEEHSSLAIPSVASVFVSRWDAAANPLLPAEMHNRLGIAVAQKAYSAYRALLASARWRALAAAGARPQRLLWASTSAKDPDLPHSYYVTSLAAPDTIDTMPEATLLSFGKHGTVGALLQPDHASAEQLIATLTAHGLDVEALGESLQSHGARRFSADWAALLDAVQSKSQRLTAPAPR